MTRYLRQNVTIARMTPAAAAMVALVTSIQNAQGKRYDVFTKYSPKTSTRNTAEMTNATSEDP